MPNAAPDTFDCLIVGARCAGAPLATHLARAGLRVCMVDAAKLPSDQPMSTHAIQPVGMAYLDELGLGDAVRAISPPVEINRLAIESAHVDVRFPRHRAMHCLRRSRLDPILQDAAVAAGAELRDQTKLVALLRDGDRVVGARVQGRNGEHELRARFVVGADGRNSSVAKLVGAKTYLETDNQRGAYWAYWPEPPALRDLDFRAYIGIGKREARFFFQTDDGLLIMGASPAAELVREFPKAPERRLREALATDPVTRALSEGNTITGRVMGMVKLRFFFREATGPGWALVGDAGLHKDPTPGLGITDALRDAKALARAIIDGRDAALEVYWRQRDVLSVPLFFHANLMGSVGFANPLNELLFERLNQTPSLGARVMSVINRERTPFEMIPPWRVLTWTALAMLGGKRGLLPHLLDTMRLGASVDREFGARNKLLKVAQQRLRSSLTASRTTGTRE